MEPQITVSNRLKEYLSKKGTNCIVVDLASCKTCGGAVSEVFARVAKPAEATRLKEEGCRTLQNDEVEIVIANRFVRIEQEISLDLRHFLGVKDITVQGLTF